MASRKGSALIITVFLITVIASVSFAVTALTIAEFRKVASLQDSIGAYYAAEAGIEQGLLQYRLFHDAEISKEIYAKIQSNEQPKQEDSPTEKASDGTPQTYRLDGLEGGPQFTNDRSKLGRAWYELKMWYKDDHIGDVDGSGKPIIGPNSRFISRDSALQISVPQGAENVNLAWEERNPSPRRPEEISPFQFFLELIFSSTEDSTLSRIVIDDGKPRQLPRLVPLGTEVFRLKPWDMEAVKYSLTFTKGNTNLKFDNQVSYVEATGHVGKAKRKLQVGINRTAGTIIESEDFLLFSGGDQLILE